MQSLVEQLAHDHNCYPVFLEQGLKQRFYKGFCKQQLWPLLHYVLPISPYSLGRFSPELWQAYVRANQEFTNTLVQLPLSADTDIVWVHDYHLMVLPSLLRKRMLPANVAVAMFMHSAFPSSEIFRAFPRREELLRSLLNADVLGFHTFDYARHFLSCCSRMIGLEHYTDKGRILLNYLGRQIHIKILPSGACDGWQRTCPMASQRPGPINIEV
jgi:trehalose 6-phosphate synthase/phosphatase